MKPFALSIFVLITYANFNTGVAIRYSDKGYDGAGVVELPMNTLEVEGRDEEYTDFIKADYEDPHTYPSIEAPSPHNAKEHWSNKKVVSHRGGENTQFWIHPDYEGSHPCPPQNNHPHPTTAAAVEKSSK